jgi:hypothetical protein
MSEIKTEDVIDIEEGENNQERGIGSFKNIIPPNVRMFMADLLGSKEKFTEKDLTPEYQNVLREIASKNVNKGSIGYEDYGIKSINQPLYKNITDARYNLKTLLGKAKVEVNKEGNLLIKDSFDFNDKKDIKSLKDLKFALQDIYGAFIGESKSAAGVGGLYSAIRQGAKYLGSGPGEGAPVEINLGKLKGATI